MYIHVHDRRVLHFSAFILKSYNVCIYRGEGPIEFNFCRWSHCWNCDCCCCAGSGSRSNHCGCLSDSTEEDEDRLV